MATHWEPKASDTGRAGTNSEPESLAAGERDAWWGEFDGLSEDEVRNRIDRKIYNERALAFAYEWFAHRETIHLHENIRAISAFTRQCSDVANQASRIALDARESISATDAATREANRAIIVALEAVLKEARISRKLAFAAGIIALLATVASCLIRYPILAAIPKF